MNKWMLCLLLPTALLASGCGKEDAPGPADPAPEQSSSLPAPVDDAEPGQATPAVPADADINPGAAADTTVTDAAVTGPAGADTASGTTPASGSAAPAATSSMQPTPSQTPTAATVAAAKAAAASATPVASPSAAAVSGAASTASPAPAVSMNGDPGTLVRADTLRARNAADAPEVASLAAGSKVKILSRDGAWYQVNADGKSGWVRMMSVRRSAAASSDVAGLAGIASGRTGTGKVVTTTGVRGLDSGDLTAATFDEARIAKAESLRVTRADAEAFARQAGLVVQAVPALPAPAK
jgi:hypothetical protein